MTDRDFERVREAAQDSRVWRGAARIIEGAMVAWQESAALTRVREGWGVASRFPTHDRLRWCAVTLAWAATLHGLARAWLPVYAVSGLPLWWNGLAVGGALIVAMAPRAFASAWRESAAVRRWSGRRQTNAL